MGRETRRGLFKRTKTESGYATQILLFTFQATGNHLLTSFRKNSSLLKRYRCSLYWLARGVQERTHLLQFGLETAN